MRCTDSKGAGTQKEITEKVKPMKVHLPENAFMGFLLSSFADFILQNALYINLPSLSVIPAIFKPESSLFIKLWMPDC
ncbi:hypothetical protein BMS3Abin06_01327 [bacterium BMS3Abin06]|nr:hypothetical protein BMS3Abin06_01327 [bacterium BMS3Abin06]